MELETTQWEEQTRRTDGLWRYRWDKRMIGGRWELRLTVTHADYRSFEVSKVVPLFATELANFDLREHMETQARGEMGRALKLKARGGV